MAEATTGLRRCIGSARFGIEAHGAPVEDFPRQPSQKDGLGRMCKTHWNAYTAGLARDAKARKAAEVSDGTEAGDQEEVTAQDPGVSSAPPERKRRRPETAESPAAASRSCDVPSQIVAIRQRAGPRGPLGAPHGRSRSSWAGGVHSIASTARSRTTTGSTTIRHSSSRRGSGNEPLRLVGAPTDIDLDRSEQQRGRVWAQVSGV